MTFEALCNRKNQAPALWPERGWFEALLAMLDDTAQERPVPEWHKVSIWYVYLLPRGRAEVKDITAIAYPAGSERAQLPVLESHWTIGPNH